MPVDRLRVGYHESRRCSRDTYPESSKLVYEEKTIRKLKISRGVKTIRDP